MTERGAWGLSRIGAFEVVSWEGAASHAIFGRFDESHEGGQCIRTLYSYHPPQLPQRLITPFIPFFSSILVYHVNYQSNLHFTSPAHLHCPSPAQTRPPDPPTYISAVTTQSFVQAKTATTPRQMRLTPQRLFAMHQHTMPEPRLPRPAVAREWRRGIGGASR